MNYAQRRRFLLILFLAGLLLIGIVANATTFVRLDLSRLAQTAAAIARLRCLSSQSISENGQIWTDTRFAVREILKGRLSSVITVRTPGGRLDGVTAHVDGVPRFSPREEAFLFLLAPPGEPYRILGWAQGTIRISLDPRSSRQLLTQDSASLPVFDPARKEFRAEGLRRVEIQDFRDRVRRALASAAKPQGE